MVLHKGSNFLEQPNLLKRIKGDCFMKLMNFRIKLRVGSTVTVGRMPLASHIKWTLLCCILSIHRRSLRTKLQSTL
jgi:hypothetical protein